MQVAFVIDGQLFARLEKLLSSNPLICEIQAKMKG